MESSTGPRTGLVTVTRAKTVAIMMAVRKKAVVVVPKFEGGKLLKRILVFDEVERGVKLGVRYASIDLVEER